MIPFNLKLYSFWWGNYKSLSNFVTTILITPRMFHTITCSFQAEVEIEKKFLEIFGNVFVGQEKDALF